MPLGSVAVRLSASPVVEGLASTAELVALKPRAVRSRAVGGNSATEKVGVAPSVAVVAESVRCVPLVAAVTMLDTSSVPLPAPTQLFEMLVVASTSLIAPTRSVAVVRAALAPTVITCEWPSRTSWKL